jgi:hypothetical protein
MSDWKEKLNNERLAEGGWYGVIAPDGWQQLVEETNERLAYLDPDYKICQVKEKFGGLRYYFDTNASEIVSDIMHAVANDAEWRSTQRCQVCGKWGTTRDLSWIRTLCDTHYEEATNE